MTPEFNAWWNEGETTTDNPYEAGSPAFWAWEGWQAGVKVEREACAKVCDDYDPYGYDGSDGAHELGREIGAKYCAAAIRARSTHDQT